MSSAKQLVGARVTLRPLELSDFAAWSKVRNENQAWLTKWEPLQNHSADPAADKSAFALRCSSRDRDIQFGVGYGFGLFVNGVLAGEINLNSVQRGPFQSGQVGYWIAEGFAGNGYVPEGLVLLMQYAFEDLELHRLEIAIVPRNDASLRVVEKLGLRNEGLAKKFLEINGVWEDHIRFAWTSEDWQLLGSELVNKWLI